MGVRLLWNCILAAPIVGAGLALARDGEEELLDRMPAHPGRGLCVGMHPSGPPGGSGYNAAFPAQGVSLLSWLSLSDLGDSSACDCTGYVSPSGREYAIIGLHTHTAFVDVTLPNSPQILLIAPAPSSDWHEIRVYKQYAYAVSEGGNGIQVFDLTQIDSGVVTHVGDVTTGGVPVTHNIAIDRDSGFLYRCGGNGLGLRIYDLNQSKTQPPFVGSWSAKYVHDAQVVTYTSGPLAGKQIAYCFGGFNNGWTQPGLTVLDVTNKSNIVKLKDATWPTAVYSHQGWLSADRHYLYVNDEADEKNLGLPTTNYIFDVANPANPVLKGSFTNGNSAVSHNAYTRGSLIFQANYRSGLRVFDATQPLAPVEIAYFDTFPLDDSAVINGLWGVYPYLPSGVVLGSDAQRGLFVWWVGPPQLTFTFSGPPPTTFNANGQSFDVTIAQQQPGQLVAGTPTLHYDDGTGWVASPMSSQGGGVWRASFPATTCGTAVQYYVSAESKNHIVWTSPSDAPGTLYTATAVCPLAYCTAKVNSLGCTPIMSWSGDPSASAGSGFVLLGRKMLNGKVGLLFYGKNGPAAIPFGGGTLCVQSPIHKTPATVANGSPPPAQNCTGTYTFDFNAWIASGVDPSLTPGVTVDAQWWARDPGFAVPDNISLSGALEFVVQP